RRSCQAPLLHFEARIGRTTMRDVRKTAVLFLTPLCLALGAVTASAQTPSTETHIANPAAIQHAMVAKVAATDADRDAVLRELRRDDVAAVASRMGLTPARAASAVSTMSPEEITRAAEAARRVDAARAGGDQVVVISTVTLLLLLILIVLIVK